MKVGYRDYIFRGGTWSSKTMSICQVLLEESIRSPILIHIVSGTKEQGREVMALMLTFYDELTSQGIKIVGKQRYSGIPTIVEVTGARGTSVIVSKSYDNYLKAKGQKTFVSFFNECDRLPEEIWSQRYKRTEGYCVYDFNPNEYDAWIYELEEKPSSYVDVSTFRDNPYVPEDIKELILSWKTTNPVLWRVHGLGERGINLGSVYDTDLWEEVSACPFTPAYVCIGIDFGFVNETAIVITAMEKDNQHMYVEEFLYASGLKPSEEGDMIEEAIERVRNRWSSGLGASIGIIGDSAESQRLYVLQERFSDIQGARKGQDSVKEGISWIRNRHRLYINGTNLKKEIKRYGFKQNVKTGKYEDVIVKEQDHLMDAMRYTRDYYYSHGYMSEVDFIKSQKGEALTPVIL